MQIQLEQHFSQLLDRKKPDLAHSEQLWDRRASEVGMFSVDKDDLALQTIQQSMDLQDKRVLDISFGAGRYLLEFLRLGADISGVEISQGMIAQARQKLQASGTSYAQENLVKSAWEDLDLQLLGWKKAFDLVFMHMSPAISSVEMLQKVLGASCGLVYITLYTQREDSLLQDLLFGFGLVSSPTSIKVADDFYAIFNLLYLWGYQPHIKFEERKQTREYTPESILERYASRLWRGDDLTVVRRNALLETLRHRSINGQVRTSGRDVIGHLLVRV